MNFVTGIEIRLSSNHNCRGIAKGQFYDICDELAGIYPKDFKFVGWHPFCRCFAIPKLADIDEFLKYQDKLDAGEDVSGYKFSGEVTQMPKQFNEWVQANEKRIKSAKSLPYFIRDNYVGGDISKGLKFASKPLTTLERAEIRHAQRTQEQIDEIKRKWKDRIYAQYNKDIDNSFKKIETEYLYERVELLALRERKKAVKDAMIANRDIEEVRKLYVKYTNGLDIQKRWTKQVWGSFSKEEIINYKKLEKTIGIRKGRPMSYEQANTGKENPLFAQSRGYKENCQTCTVTHYLRRLGFNIMAKPNDYLTKEKIGTIYKKTPLIGIKLARTFYK